MKEAELKSLTPGTNALVMEFTGDHFNSYRVFKNIGAAERAMLEDHEKAKQQARQAKQRMKQQTKRARLAELTENAKKRKKEMGGMY